jgi:hypothetical protein
MSEIEVQIGVLTERVDNMEKQVDSVVKKVEGFQNWFLLTLGGLAVNLLVLLLKK